MSEYRVDYGEPLKPGRSIALLPDHVWRVIQDDLAGIAAEVEALLKAKTRTETRSRQRKKTPDDASPPSSSPRRGNYISPDEADDKVVSYERAKADERWQDLKTLIQRIRTFVDNKLSGKLSNEIIQSEATDLDVEVVQVSDRYASDEAFAGFSRRLETEWNSIKRELGLWSDDSMVEE